MLTAREPSNKKARDAMVQFASGGLGATATLSDSALCHETGAPGGSLRWELSPPLLPEGAGAPGLAKPRFHRLKFRSQ